MRSCWITQGVSLALCDDLAGSDGGGERGSGGRVVCIIMADLHCCTAETKRTSYSKFPPIKKYIFKKRTRIGWNEGRLSNSQNSTTREQAKETCCCLAAKSCPTPCHPMDCSLLGSSVLGFPRQEHWSGLPLPSPEEINPPSPALAGGFFTTKPRGKPS